MFLRGFYHPIDAALIHRGFSHSLVFAILMGPLLGWLIHRLYKKRYEQKTWMWLFFLGIVTHPLLDIFTNYGTEFLWPFSLRITFNTVFVIDPLYTVPFMITLLVALFMKRDNPKRKNGIWPEFIILPPIYFGGYCETVYSFECNELFCRKRNENNKPNGDSNATNVILLDGIDRR